MLICQNGDVCSRLSVTTLSLKPWKPHGSSVLQHFVEDSSFKTVNVPNIKHMQWFCEAV